LRLRRSSRAFHCLPGTDPRHPPEHAMEGFCVEIGRVEGGFEGAEREVRAHHADRCGLAGNAAGRGRMDSDSKLIADLYAAFARGDVPFILERLTADVRFDNSDSPEMPYRGSYKGKDGVAKFFGDIGGAVEVKSFEPKTYLSSGGEVMTTGVWSCVARATGKPFTSQWAMRFMVRDGKVSYAHVYEDTAVTVAAMRQ
jgi:ketosteroid isomerase-like protein